MLAQVRRRAAGLDLGNVETLLCNVGDMPFADGGFDIVTSRSRAHHFLDLDADVHEMAPVLRQGPRRHFAIQYADRAPWPTPATS